MQKAFFLMVTLASSQFAIADHHSLALEAAEAQMDGMNRSIELTTAEQKDNQPFNNYNALKEDGQGFFLKKGKYQYETPNSAAFDALNVFWWCDLHFLDDGGGEYGYVGRMIKERNAATTEIALAQGAQMPAVILDAESVSAIWVPSLKVFQGQYHAQTDDRVNIFVDDGTATLQMIGWEGHDEGDIHPNAETSSWSSAGTVTKISASEASEYFDLDASEMTPEKCMEVYKDVHHRVEQNKPGLAQAASVLREEEQAQLKANMKEVLSRLDTVEEELSGSKAGGTNVE